MTIQQKQHLLAYLGYYTGEVDGDWGDKSREATRDFQRAYNLDDDGVFGKNTKTKILSVIGSGVDSKVTVKKPSGGANWWKDIKYFDRDEFRCQCGGKYCNGFPVEPEEKMVRTVDEIRRRLGVPVQIVDAGGSGVRCKTHNANVGGVADSQHLYGKAADLHSSASPARMKQVAEEVMGNTGGIGVYSWGIHVDTRKTKSRWNG